jgi:beta-1,4-mannooligosaccharide/beta-1,4-mannosyl-N-acetylglucosamine phosphorylase
MEENQKIGVLQSASILHRYPDNPVLTSKQVPYPSVIAYNAGVIKYQGRYVMVFRNDYDWNKDEQKAVGFQLGLAFSDDGIHWQTQPRPILQPENEEVLGSIDPRITLLEGRCYITYCQYTRPGFLATIAATTDFEHFEIISKSEPDNRDMVLFPDKIGGRYIRLDRPFPRESRQNQDRFDIWISESPDLIYWGRHEPLLCVEDIPYANARLGAGTPPVRTEWGWLSLFHAVDFDSERGKNGWEDKWQKRYTAGVLLQDLENPRKVIASSRSPLIAPEADYEAKEGFRTNVIFPTAMVLEDTGEVKIYYGAADTAVALATTDLESLVRFCKNEL